jgi:hypothetical protein
MREELAKTGYLLNTEDSKMLLEKIGLHIKG